MKSSIINRFVVTIAHLKSTLAMLTLMFLTITMPSFSVNAAISPEAQQQKDLLVMQTFIEDHPKVLAGLQKIRLFDGTAKLGNKNPHVREVIYTINRKNTDTNQIETVECVATFAPTFLSFFLPNNSVSFLRSNCEID